MFVNGYMWTICRPVKCNHVARTHEEREVEEPGITTSRGVTVDELSGIFASFIQQNSSVSQDKETFFFIFQILIDIWLL